MRHIRHNHANTHAQKVVELAHPGGVALGQIIIHCYQMHALARQGIEVHRKRCYQSLAFAGAHFGNSPRMQHHATDQLHVVVTQAEYATRGFAANCKRFGKDLIESCTFA